jgi:esterase/lipase superfamily enzyme
MAKHVPERPFHLQQIVLTAADIDRDELAQLSSKLHKPGARVTLYASGRDEAILLSTAVHGGYPRAVILKAKFSWLQA